MKTIIKIALFSIALSNPNIKAKEFNNCLKVASTVLRNKKANKKEATKKIELIACK